MKKYYSCFFVFLTFILLQSLAIAQTCTFNGAGGNNNWNRATNWDCGRVPNPESDNVVIPAGFNVRRNNDLQFKGTTLTINGSLDMRNNKLEMVSNSFLTINSSGSLINTFELFFNSGGDGLFENGATVVVSHLKTDDSSILTVNTLVEVTAKLENLSGSEIQGLGALDFDCNDDFANNGTGGIFGCTSSNCKDCTLDGASSCTSCDQIVRAPDTGNYTVSDNEILCVVGIGGFNGDISLNGANSQLCISENVTYTGNLNINRDNSTVNNFGTISGISLNTQGTFNNFGSLQLINLNVNNGEVNVFNTSGTVEVSGSVIINNATDVNLEVNATVGVNLTINGSGDLNLDGAFVAVGGTLSPGSTSNSINGLGNTSGCEGISFSNLNLNNNNSFSGNVDICNIIDPNSTPTLPGSTRCECSGLLPVEFINYTTKANYEQEAVEILWSTATEQNSVLFEIERSSNGYDFDAIGKVSAAGNSESVNNYSFFDYTPIFGNGYYRLKQVDLDGTFTHTNVMVQFYENKKSTNAMEVVLSGDDLQLNFSEYIEKAQLEIVNYTGKVILQKEIEVNAYSNVQKLKSLMPGIYFIRLRSQNQVWAKKVLFN